MPRMRLQFKLNLKQFRLENVRRFWFLNKKVQNVLRLFQRDVGRAVVANAKLTPDCWQYVVDGHDQWVSQSWHAGWDCPTYATLYRQFKQTGKVKRYSICYDSGQNLAFFFKNNQVKNTAINCLKKKNTAINLRIITFRKQFWPRITLPYFVSDHPTWVSLVISYSWYTLRGKTLVLTCEQ